MTIYYFIEDRDNYLNTSGSLWQYHKDEPFLNKVTNFSNINKK